MPWCMRFYIIKLWNNGVFLIVLAAFLFSLTSLAVKIEGNDLPIVELVFFPSVFCFLLTLITQLAVHIRSARWRRRLFIRINVITSKCIYPCFDPLIIFRSLGFQNSTSLGSTPPSNDFSRFLSLDVLFSFTQSLVSYFHSLGWREHQPLSTEMVSSLPTADTKNRETWAQAELAEDEEIGGADGNEEDGDESEEMEGVIYAQGHWKQQVNYPEAGESDYQKTKNLETEDQKLKVKGKKEEEGRREVGENVRDNLFVSQLEDLGSLGRNKEEARRKRKKERGMVLFLTLLRAVLGSVTVISFYAAIAHLPLEDAVALFFCSPVVAAALECLVLRTERLTWAIVAGCTFTLLGVVLLSKPDLIPVSFGFPDDPVFSLWSSLSPLPSDPATSVVSISPSSFASLSHPLVDSSWVSVALLSAVANALSFIVIRRIGQRQSAVNMTLFYHTVVALSSGAIFALLRGAEDGEMKGGTAATSRKEESMNVASLLASSPSLTPSLPLLSTPLHLQTSASIDSSPTTRIRLLILITMTQFLGQILLNRGFQLESATKGSAVNVVQMLFSYVWEILVLKKPVVLASMMGSGAIAVGVLLVALMASSSSPESSSRPIEWLASDDKKRTNTDNDSAPSGHVAFALTVVKPSGTDLLPLEK